MIKLTTDRGAELTAAYALNTKNAPNKLVLSLEDGRSLSQIAAEIEGCAAIRAVYDDEPNVLRLFEGFTTLDDMRRMGNGVVRVTLFKEG